MILSLLWNPSASKLIHVRWTCSIQGLYEQKVPWDLSAFFADAMAFQGQGRSRKTASATFSSPNPRSSQTSWHRTVTLDESPFFWNSSLARSALVWLNSNVCKWPVGAIVRRNDVDNDPLPVPTWRNMKWILWILWIWISIPYRIQSRRVPVGVPGLQ